MDSEAFCRDLGAALAHGPVLDEELRMTIQERTLDIGRMKLPADRRTLQMSSSPLPAAIGVCVALARLISTWRQRSRQRQALAELDDRLLRDVGLSRADAARECAKPFWR
jgi:uncharacterized protein YjiS (DUF1127 family)